MTILTLVRHGQASFGGANYDELSPLGHRQAQLLGAHWARIGGAFDACYSGRLARQRDTATRLLEAFPGTVAPQVEPAFDEYDFIGILRGYLPLVARENPQLALDHGKLYKEPKLFQSAFEHCVACWIGDRPVEGSAVESWRHFSERVRAGLAAVTPPGREHAVVVTSGGVIAVALREALKLTDDTAFQLNWRVYNASVHRFRVGKRGLSLMGFNDVAHLELAADPALLTFR